MLRSSQFLVNRNTIHFISIFFTNTFRKMSSVDQRFMEIFTGSSFFFFFLMIKPARENVVSRRVFWGKSQIVSPTNVIAEIAFFDGWNVFFFFAKFRKIDVWRLGIRNRDVRTKNKHPGDENTRKDETRLRSVFVPSRICQEDTGTFGVGKNRLTKGNSTRHGTVKTLRDLVSTLRALAILFCHFLVSSLFSPLFIFPLQFGDSDSMSGTQPEHDRNSWGSLLVQRPTKFNGPSRIYSVSSLAHSAARERDRDIRKTD